MSAGGRGQGVGAALLSELVTISQREHFWTLQAHVIAGNAASRALHRGRGFREVGVRERFGHIGAVWHDVVLLERRSTVTGGPELPTRACGAQ